MNQEGSNHWRPECYGGPGPPSPPQQLPVQCRTSTGWPPGGPLSPLSCTICHTAAGLQLPVAVLYVSTLLSAATSRTHPLRTTTAAPPLTVSPPPPTPPPTHRVEVPGRYCGPQLQHIDHLCQCDPLLGVHKPCHAVHTAAVQRTLSQQQLQQAPAAHTCTHRMCHTQCTTGQHRGRATRPRL